MQVSVKLPTAVGSSWEAPAIHRENPQNSLDSALMAWLVPPGDTIAGLDSSGRTLVKAGKHETYRTQGRADTMGRVHSSYRRRAI
jgi:hypothetical protein